jgi:hypothetical protein
MSISVSVYSNANSSSKSISFDFVGDILAPDDVAANASCQSFYFKISASAVQDNNAAYPVKIVRSLSDLALFKPGDATGKVQSASNTGADYTSVKTMIIDYIYDYINGHTANQFSSGCTVQHPMKF